MCNDISLLARDLLELAVEGNSPDKIVKKLKRLYPEAKIKDVMRAAFQLVVEISGTNPDAAMNLHAVAISNCGPE